MTSAIDTTTIGKPPEPHARAKRRHVRSLTGTSSSLPYLVSIVRSRIGDFPEVDEKGQEKWPKGDENTWKVALRGVASGELSSHRPSIPRLTVCRVTRNYKVYRESCSDIARPRALQYRRFWRLSGRGAISS